MSRSTMNIMTCWNSVCTLIHRSILSSTIVVKLTCSKSRLNPYFECQFCSKSGWCMQVCIYPIHESQTIQILNRKITIRTRITIMNTFWSTEHRTQFWTAVTWGLHLSLRGQIRPFEVIQDRDSWQKRQNHLSQRSHSQRPRTSLLYYVRKVSEANIESSLNSERPKMGSGDPFVDLLCIGFSKNTQDFGFKFASLNLSPRMILTNGRMDTIQWVRYFKLSVILLVLN